MAESQKSIKYETLGKIELQNDRMQKLKIRKGNHTYCLKIHPKSSHDKCMIFSNGAVDPKKNKPPIYMRSSWTGDIDGDRAAAIHSTWRKSRIYWKTCWIRWMCRLKTHISSVRQPAASCLSTIRY